MNSSMRRIAERWWLVCLASLAGVVLTAWLLHSSDLSRRQSVQRAAQRQVDSVLQESVSDVLGREVALARIIGVLHGPIGARWPALASVVTGQPVANGAGFIQPVPDRDRATFVRRTGLRLVESPVPGRIVPARRRPLHLVLTQYLQTTAQPATLGMDLAANPLRGALLLRAARTGQQLATPPVEFLGRPVNRYGVIVYVPVRGSRRQLLGWVTASYEAHQLANLVTARIPGVRLRIVDGTTLVAGPGALPGRPATIAVAGRRWQVWAATTPGAASATPWLVGGFGLALVFALAVILRGLGVRERRAVRALAERDAEEAALGRIATLVAEQAEPERVFALVADELATLLGARTAGVTALDAEARTVTLVGASSSQSGSVVGTRFPIDSDSAAGVALRTGRPARLDQNQYHPAEVLPDAAAFRSMSAVAAPVHVGSRRWGTVGVGYDSPQPPPGVEGRLERFAGVVALSIANADAWKRLEHQAGTDSLTEIANRRVFHDRLAAELARARRYERQLAIAIFDLDHFKQINDSQGHGAGDRVLQRFARLLSGHARQGELVARLGGEEFAWLMPETDDEGAYVAAERLRLMTERGFSTLTVSAGISSAGEADDLDALMRHADRALYRAKQTGRNRVVVYKPAGDARPPATTAG